MINTYQIEPRNQAHSILIQMALFKLGYQWFGRRQGRIAQFTDAKYLLIKNINGVGEISWSDIDLDHDTVEYEDREFKVRHYPELVVEARNKWRDEMELNQTLNNHPLLNDYRKNRDSNQFRIHSGVEQLCEYVLYLEKRIEALS